MKKVAIVGLPNSGKSTLFNRLTGRRRALVHRAAGMTRDRIYGKVKGRQLTVIDTGGVTDAQDDLQRAIQRQVQLAITESDIVLVLLDGSQGLNPLERDLVGMIRKSKPFVVAVNKIDVDSHEERLSMFAELGCDPVAVSAEHGRGVGELLERLVEDDAADSVASAETDRQITIAIVGRPNAGKSTLLNTLVGYERASVSPLPGTTRDCVDADLTSGGRRFRILDTAGIRRKTKIDDSQEIISVLAARKTIPVADCTLLVVDGVAGISAHDRYLASEVATTARSAVILVNKMDAAESFEPKAATLEARKALKELSWAPLVFISALEGRFTNRILSTVVSVVEEGSKEIPTPALNEFLERFFEMHTPMYSGGMRAPIKYGLQVGRLPVTIQLFSKRRSQLMQSYEKQLLNRLRRAFGLERSPVRLLLKTIGA